MLFSAGLGVGIVFWGVAEPMTHYLKSPLPNEVDGSTLESARLAMGYTFSHWGHFTMVYLCNGRAYSSLLPV